jgi:hypothetical protein
VAGAATCNASGTGFGACVGEIVPSPETCATAADDDCDGQTNEEGAACVCAPGSTSPCYTGPAGTAGIGACHGGTHTCSGDGTAYGPCEGEVVPTAESCLSAPDDDCDGQTNEEGAGCVCLPGSTASCYTGPPGTAGVGLCVAGTATCPPSGTAWGPCLGQVTPVAEDCATPSDDDCNGTALCGAPLILAKQLGGGASDEAALDVNVDGAGNLYVTGWFTGTVDFGAGPLASAGDKDIFVLKMTPSGDVLWSKRFGTSMQELGAAIAVDAAGNILVAGDFQYQALSTVSVDFGLGPVLSSAPPSFGISFFVVKLDGSGNAIWHYTLGADNYSRHARDVVLDPAGNPHALWWFYTGVQFATGMTKVAGATGTELWTKAVPGDAERSGIAVDSAGNALSASGNVGFTCCFPSKVILTKRDPGGNQVWSHEHSGQTFPSGGVGHVAAADAASNLIAAGQNSGELDFGGGVLPAPGMFLVKVDPAGNHVWSKNIAAGASSNIDPRAMAMDVAGQIVVTGAQTQAIDYGGGPVPGSSFLAKFDPSGAHVWSKSLSTLSVSSVAVDAAGKTIVVGTFTGTIDVGSGPITSSGGTDSLLAIFGP